MNPLILGVLAVAGFIVFDKLQTAGTAQRLNYLITSTRFEFQFLQVTAFIYVGIQNPTSNSVTFNSLAGSLYLNGEYVANVSSFASTAIPGNQETNIEIKVRLSTIEMGAELVAWLKNPSGVIVMFDGTININNSPVPVNLAYNVL